MEHPLSKPGPGADKAELTAVEASHQPRRAASLTGAHLLAPAAAMLALLVVWEAWTRLADIPVYIVPAPTAVATRILGDPGYFAAHGASTLAVALSGFLAGSAVAVGIATLMVHSRLLERALYPLALFVKVVPLLVWGLLFVIWFGFGSLPKVLISAIITFFPVMVNTLSGLRSVDGGALDFFRSVHASKTEIFFKLRVPSSLTYVLAAFRIAIPLSVIGAFVAEYFTGDSGIGSVISSAHSNLDMPTVFSGVFVLAVMAVSLTALASYAERRLLFWHESFTTARPA